MSLTTKQLTRRAQDEVGDWVKVQAYRAKDGKVRYSARCKMCESPYRTITSHQVYLDLLDRVADHKLKHAEL